MVIDLSPNWKMGKVIFKLAILLYTPFVMLITIEADKSDKEDVQLLTLIWVIFSIFIFSTIYIEKNFIRLLTQKVKFTQEKISMISNKKERNFVYVNKNIYYEIIRLTVDRCISKEFVILSNSEFEFLNQFDSLGFVGLGKICEIIYNDNSKIIVPYNEKTTPWLKLDIWIQIKENNHKTGDG